MGPGLFSTLKALASLAAIITLCALRVLEIATSTRADDTALALLLF